MVLWGPASFLILLKNFISQDENLDENYYEVAATYKITCIN